MPVKGEVDITPTPRHSSVAGNGVRQSVQRMIQTPLFLNKSPFHEYTLQMNEKLETSRDCRLSRIEESGARHR
jgi:hypothetical protein